MKVEPLSLRVFSINNILISEINLARYAYRTDPWSTLHPYVFSGSKPPPVTVRQEPSTISCARYWMRECRKHHYLCDASRKASLPSRVIDVDVKGSGRRPFLKISKNEVAHYVALSHTWSSSRSLRLTSRNLEDLQQSIPMEDLSQTFRDAIHITRKLDIQYLWIDSICIMQNSQDDWVKESSRMADVYKGATLTIAAFSPSVGPGACILPYERPLFEMPCMLSSNLLIEGEWYYDKPVNSNTTLSDRGWTLQEEQLSYRILYCDKPFLRWRCLFGEARYDMPNRWKKEMNHFSTMLNSSVGYDVVWNKQHHILWRRLVQDYSCRKLTVQLDKLPAISGLASHFIQILQDLQPDYKEEIKLSSTDYLAGHWKQDLLQTILWTKKHPSKPRTTTDYIAPTWSWASSKHAIKAARAWRMEGEPPEANEYDDTSSFYAWCDKEAILTGKWYARVIHAETTLSTVDPFGRVSAGKLVISGPILDFPWFITERSANISGPTFHGDFSSQSRKIHERDHFVYEVPRENVEDKIPWFVPKMRAKNPRWTQKQLLEKFRLQFPNIKLDVRCYLPFECTVLRINNCEGLLLEPVRQEGGGTVYKRVGVCSVGREWDEKLREHEKEPGYKWVIDVCSWGDWKMDEVTIV